jgi:catechol 2,3-dioxygenase-like lactoylglutathione lyase family enzyme
MVTGFSHVQLEVRDVAVSAEWYRVVLGMEQFTSGTFAGGDYAGLRSRTGRFVIGLQGTLLKEAGADPAPMIEHLSFGVEDRADLERHRAAIAAAGIDIGEPFEEALSWNVRLRDPDGLVVELTCAK